MASTLSNYWRFLLAGLMKQSQTGAIVPSQRFLIDKMIAPIPRGYQGQIIELGPGTGALTLRLAERCPHARILACEINPLLARNLQHCLVEKGLNRRIRVVSDSAEHLLGQMVRNGNHHHDFVLSGIPLANLTREQVLSLTGTISGLLRPGGLYIQFQYSLIDRKKIKAQFSRLRTVPVLLNFPPAVVYYARK